MFSRLRALIGVLVVVVLLCGAGNVAVSASADTPALSALVERAADAGVAREDGVGGASVAVTVGSGTWAGATSHSFLGFASEINNAYYTKAGVDVSAGLGPGTYSTSSDPTAAQAYLSSDMITARCISTATGTLTVFAAAYDDAGAATEYAASYDVTACGGAPFSVHGQIWWNSTQPLGFVQAPDLSSIPGTVVVNSSAREDVTMTAAGNTPITLGTVSLTQTPLPDGSMYWSIAADACSGVTLQPADTCTVQVLVAPLEPNGTPSAIQYASLVVPDGGPLAAVAPMSARVAPLDWQPVGLHVEGAFRHLVLTWGRPQAASGWSNTAITTYRVYSVDQSNTETLVATVLGSTWLVLNGLPDGYGRTFVVTAAQSGPGGPPSRPATGATPTSELIYPLAGDGLYNRALMPSATNPTYFYGLGANGSTFIGRNVNVTDLAVARDESTIAWDSQSYTVSPGHALVATIAADGSGPGYSSGPAIAVPGPWPNFWDTHPTVSPDGWHVVYTHANTPTDTATVLRIAGTSRTSIAHDVPDSTGLSDPAYTADGSAVVAVEPTQSGTDLVTLNLTTGVRTVIPNSAGLTQPDVAADGRIVALAPTDQAQPHANGLVVLDADGSVRTAIAAVQDGINVHPRFSADGTTVYFSHNDDESGSYGLYRAESVDLSSGALTTLLSSQSSSYDTPLVLTSTAHHLPDYTPPATTLTTPTNPVALTPTVTVSWTATDPLTAGESTSGVTSYDVRYRTTNLAGTTAAYTYPADLQNTSQTGAALTLSPGNEYCISTRATDVAGNTSVWGAEHCLNTPLDDRALTTTAARLIHPAYYLGTYSKSAKTGTTFTHTGVSAARVGVVLTTCSTCGALDVYLAGTYLGRISSHTATTSYRQTRWLPPTTQRTGTLTLRAVSAAQILLDAIITNH